MRCLLSAALAALIGLSAVTARAAGDAPAPEPGRAGAAPIGIELNRLEARDGDCRLYLVFDNRSPVPYESLRLDLIFFGTDGVIARRLAVDAAPLRAAKRTVKLFDVAGLGCDAVGQILVNDVLSCRDGAGRDRSDCADGLALSSRVAAVPLAK